MQNPAEFRPPAISMTDSFKLLLEHLDSDENAAAEKYLTLYSKIVKIIIWKRFPESEAERIADIVVDRIAKKIKEGEEIQNVNAYARTVLNFVLLEQNRKNKEDAVGDDLPEVWVSPEIADEPDLRIECLRKCLGEISSSESDKRLIVGYYEQKPGGKTKDNRKSLAKNLGLTMNHLKVKASRLRGRLEKCINGCVRKLSVTDSANSDTTKQGGAKR